MLRLVRPSWHVSSLLTRQLSTIFNSKESRFNDVHVHLNDLQQVDVSQFDLVLKHSLLHWEKTGKSSAWLHVPMQQASCIEIASKHGFKYHHAEDNTAVVFKWLRTDSESKIPRYATHQMGCAGLCYRKETDEILVIKEKHVAKSFWKLPGGAADLGEYIEDAAVREVREETGIKSEFRSIIAFRQQHDYPGAYNRSDLYVVCRLEPITYTISPCNTEIADCKWMQLNEILTCAENNLLKRLAKLIDHAKRNNFDFSLIDIDRFKMKSMLTDKNFSFYHKNIPDV